MLSFKEKTMGKAQPVELPSIHFPAKTKVKQFFKEMLSRFKDGDDVNPEDQVLLTMSIRTRHPLKIQ